MAAIAAGWRLPHRPVRVADHIFEQGCPSRGGRIQLRGADERADRGRLQVVAARRVVGVFGEEAEPGCDGLPVRFDIIERPEPSPEAMRAERVEHAVGGIFEQHILLMLRRRAAMGDELQPFLAFEEGRLGGLGGELDPERREGAAFLLPTGPAARRKLDCMRLSDRGNELERRGPRCTLRRRSRGDGGDGASQGDLDRLILGEEPGRRLRLRRSNCGRCKRKRQYRCEPCPHAGTPSWLRRWAAICPVLSSFRRGGPTCDCGPLASRR